MYYTMQSNNFKYVFFDIMPQIRDIVENFLGSGPPLEGVRSLLFV